MRRHEVLPGVAERRRTVLVERRVKVDDRGRMRRLVVFPLWPQVAEELMRGAVWWLAIFYLLRRAVEGVQAQGRPAQEDVRVSGILVVCQAPVTIGGSQVGGRLPSGWPPSVVCGNS